MVHIDFPLRQQNSPQMLTFKYKLTNVYCVFQIILSVAKNLKCFLTGLCRYLVQMLSSVAALQGNLAELKEVHSAYHVVTGVIRAKKKFKKTSVAKSPVLPRHLRLTKAVGLLSN